MSAPTANEPDTLDTSLSDADSISVSCTPCIVYTLLMSSIRPNPLCELSFNLPTKGETYFAPAFAASIACAVENMSVTFTWIRSRFNSRHAHSPSGVHGTLIVAMLPYLSLSARPSCTISSPLPPTSILMSVNPISAISS